MSLARYWLRQSVTAIAVAQWKAELFARRPKPAKLTTNPKLRHYVQDRLEGKVP